MDRGRAGGFVTDNNLAEKKALLKRHEKHLERLESIKKRKPGQSIDNSSPLLIPSQVIENRKVALRNEINYETERENK